ncbi:MAG TPA: hypothetical protein VNM16_09730, partial [Bacillota bacterium]|nr:hypothetical protein [Bacillota bacterium]
IVKDPRVGASQADLEGQFALLAEVRDKVTALHAGLTKIRSVRGSLDEWVKRAEGHRVAATVVEKADAIKAKLAPIEAELIPVKTSDKPSAGRLPPRLNDELLHLAGVIASADWAPNTQSRALYQETAAAVDDSLARLQAVLDKDVREFGEYIQEFGISPIKA